MGIERKKNMKEIKEFCKRHNLTIEQFNGTEKIESDLDLRNLTSIPEGFNPTVGGYLDLESLTSIPKGFNPTVGRYLDLGSLTSIPKGFNPTVGGCLDLSSLTSIPKGFNPTVGGDLDLHSLTSIPEEFNPTVGGDLDLRNLTSIPKGFNPTVGGSLYLRNDLTCVYNKLVSDYLSWEDGKYIKVDGIFCELIRKRGNVFSCKKINKEEYFYVVTDGYGKYSHGETIKQAKEDLIYKLSNVDKSVYERLTLGDILSFEKSIECYRVITGACSFGTKNFVETILLEKKKEYAISEIIELTKNQHGNQTFKQFFN